MWLIGGLGFLRFAAGIRARSFIRPSQIAVGSNTVVCRLIIGCIVVVAAPFIIYASRKPSWVDKDT